MARPVAVDPHDRRRSPSQRRTSPSHPLGRTPGEKQCPRSDKPPGQTVNTADSARTMSGARNTATRHPAGLRGLRPLACSVANMVAIAESSGRRGRRFKSCHPDQCHRSLTCGNAVPCARRPTSQQSRQRPQGTKRNTKEPQGKPGPTSTGRRTPGLPARGSRPRGTVGSIRAL
jgi:hypothetical protein